jgi:hypothetical protein
MIFDMGPGGKASPEQVKELQEARKVSRRRGPRSHDAEAAYKKPNSPQPLR